VTPLDASALETAIIELERELEARRSPRPYAPLAESYRLQNRLEDSIDTARAGIAAYPGHISIRIVLARALDNSGRLEEATEMYHEVARLDPDNAEAVAFLEKVHTGSLIDQVEKGAPEETSSTEQEAAAGEGAFPETGSLAEELEHLAGLFSTRGTDSSPALASDLDAIATLTLAEIYAKQGLPDKAVEVCERILATNPDDEVAQQRLVDYGRAMAEVE
jgi:tetratricopeptide (TPR) repeat protein